MALTRRLVYSLHPGVCPPASRRPPSLPLPPFAFRTLLTPRPASAKVQVYVPRSVVDVVYPVHICTVTTYDSSRMYVEGR